MENKPQQTAYMYVVKCSDQSLYTGYTTDIERRIKTHNAGKGAKYTRARLPVELLYFETFNSKEEAMSAEAKFKKKTRKAKIEYLKSRSVKFD
jgi:putative endonuclease